LFAEHSVDALERALRRALDVYQDRAEWDTRVRRAMRRHFGWSHAVSRYLEVYRRALARVAAFAPKKTRHRAAPARRLPRLWRATTVA